MLNNHYYIYLQISSTDSITWHAATLFPDYNAGAITILNGHTVTVTANITIDETTVKKGGLLIINPNVVVTLHNGQGEDLIIE